MDRKFSRKRNASCGDAIHPAAGRTKRRAMHPNNKYAERPPEFNHLASLYPSFSEFITYGPNKKPRLDWTDFNATRELTRVLLDHDFGIKWWIPDGQLCPTVPNRANYIHWIDDLLSVFPAPWHSENPSQIRGVDIGTGANCIYPLLGAALHGWHFVGTDITPVALDWAKKNVEQNPQYAEHIEVRKAAIDISEDTGVDVRATHRGVSTVDTYTPSEIEAPIIVDENVVDSSSSHALEGAPDNGSLKTGLPPMPLDACAAPSETSLPEALEEDKTCVPTDDTNYGAGVIGPSVRPDEFNDVPPIAPVLWGVLKEGERFDFCMCNPPFFESIEEAGLNPRTACGGTSHEMVCPGGELAFITKIIGDSEQLGTKIHWYTSMVGRKVNLKAITSHLRAVGVTMLRTTEFVQGRTSRWGIAWSFSTVQKAVVLPGRSVGRNKVSFILEGINRQFSAMDVLQELSNQLQACGAINTVDVHSFSLSVSLIACAFSCHNEGKVRCCLLPSFRVDVFRGQSLYFLHSFLHVRHWRQGGFPTDLDESQGQYDVPTATKVEDKINNTSKSGSILFQASVQTLNHTQLTISRTLKSNLYPSFCLRNCWLDSQFYPVSIPEPLRGRT